MNKFSPGRRTLARRRSRITSVRGIVTLSLLLALAIGGGVFAWRWQVRQALEANTPEASLAEECADLAEMEEDAGEVSTTEVDADDEPLAARIARCEDAGYLSSDEEP